MPLIPPRLLKRSLLGEHAADFHGTFVQTLGNRRRADYLRH